MKKIPIALLNAYGKQGSSTCFLVKVETKNDEVKGFCSLDANLQFNDGEHDILYSADEELRPQNIQMESNLAVDNTNLVGWFSEAMAKKVVAGEFDFSRVTIYRVNYLRLQYGAEIIGFGTIGEIDFAKNEATKRVLEFRSLMQQLKQEINKMYSLTCRADFGDDDCGMPFEWHAGTITGVGINAQLQITISGVTGADDYFNYGIVEILEGDNQGATLEVEKWFSTGSTKLTYLSPFPLTIGTDIRIRRDCGKTEADCIAYGNMINMQAEPDTPAQDKSIMVPGAYVKSVNAL